MRAGGLVCVNQDVQSTGGTEMKIAMIEKPAATESRTTDRIRPSRAGTRRGVQTRSAAAADQQVAEIERTFSVRWEW